MRLGFQQQVTNYSLVVAGLIAPVLALAEEVGQSAVLPVLLVGPILCIFLQLTYIKQHVFIDLLSSYISTQLGISGQPASDKVMKGSLPFAGWERFLSRLYTDSRLNRYTAVLGYAEGGFPTLVAVLYLIAFLAILILADPVINSIERVLLLLWGVADTIGLVVAFSIGVRVRQRVASRRQAEVNTG